MKCPSPRQNSRGHPQAITARPHTSHPGSHLSAASSDSPAVATSGINPTASASPAPTERSPSLGLIPAAHHDTSDAAIRYTVPRTVRVRTRAAARSAPRVRPSTRERNASAAARKSCACTPITVRAASSRSNMPSPTSTAARPSGRAASAPQRAAENTHTCAGLHQDATPIRDTSFRVRTGLLVHGPTVSLCADLRQFVACGRSTGASRVDRRAWGCVHWRFC